MAMAALNANPVFAAAAAVGAGTSPPNILPTTSLPSNHNNGGGLGGVRIGQQRSKLQQKKGYGMQRTFEVASDAESDLAIHCEDSVFHVHRALLSLASPVWDRMLNGAFAESVSDTIVFEEDCPLALNYVLGILYCPEEFSQHSNPFPNLNIIRRGSEAEVEALLDKYQLHGVRKCIISIKANNQLNKSNEAAIYRLREDNGLLLQMNQHLQGDLRTLSRMSVADVAKTEIAKMRKQNQTRATLRVRSERRVEFSELEEYS